MERKRIFRLQRRVGIVIIAAGVLVTAANLFYFGTRMPLPQAVLRPTVAYVALTVLLILPTVFLDSALSRLLQLAVVFGNALLSILSQYDSIHGLGLYLLCIFLAFKYHFLDSRLRLKIGFSILLVFVCTLFSAPLSRFSIALLSAFNAVIYIALFLTVSYLILKDEIDEALAVQRQRLLKPVDLEAGGITPGELRVLEVLVREKASDKEIAARLFLSVGTVKNYVRTIKQKLEVSTRYALIDRCRNNFPH